MDKIRVNIVSESDISVQGHGVHTAYMEMAGALEKRKDIELIRGEFGKNLPVDIVHLHTIGSRVWRKLLKGGPKKVVSAHVVPDSFVGSLVGARLWKAFATWYLRWFYNKADLLVAVSPATANELKHLGVKTPVVVIDNSIDISRYHKGSKKSRNDLRKQLGIDVDSFVVIGAGQVQPRKRVDRFITAAKACPDVEFIWVGGIPFGSLAAEHGSMQKMMDGAPSNVHFPGIIPLSNMPSYYSAADVFWLPSTQETFGLVVVEAAASGLPVILRDIKDYSETFAPYSILVDDNTDIDAIRKLRDNLEHRKKYKSLATNLAKKFDSKSATDKLVEQYRVLLKNKHV
jgi:1,2-diacylglycerol-3-alpha-glucose alpha-1,2-galactosyltransferase